MQVMASCSLSCMRVLTLLDPPPASSSIKTMVSPRCMHAVGVKQVSAAQQCP